MKFFSTLVAALMLSAFAFANEPAAPHSGTPTESADSVKAPTEAAPTATKETAKKKHSKRKSNGASLSKKAAPKS
jgi:hypothetical protein